VAVFELARNSRREHTLSVTPHPPENTSAGTQVVPLLEVRTLCARDELRARWANAGQRADIIHQPAERRTRGGAACAFASSAAQAGQPDADLFDPLGRLGFDAPWRKQLPEVLKLPLISPNGNANEIIGEFLGSDRSCSLQDTCEGAVK
jgi:hypothetical protein